MTSLKEADVLLCDVETIVKPQLLHNVRLLEAKGQSLALEGLGKAPVER